MGTPEDDLPAHRLGSDARAFPLAAETAVAVQFDVGAAREPPVRARHGVPLPRRPAPPGNERDDRAAEELSKDVGLDAGTESPTEENAGETPKSPEQSENVIENKGPAAEGVRE